MSAWLKSWLGSNTHDTPGLAGLRPAASAFGNLPLMTQSLAEAEPQHPIEHRRAERPDLHELSEPPPADPCVQAIRTARRQGRMAEAVVMLRAEVERQDALSRETGLAVTPWYYEQLAIIYRRYGLQPEELEILERYERQTREQGAGSAKLAERLAKVRAMPRP